MNRLSLQRRAQIVHHLVRNNSMRGTAELLGCDVNTVQWLVEDLGPVCKDFHNRTVLGLKLEQLQLDETHSFVHTRERNLPPEKRGTRGIGDTYTWIAIDPKSKLTVSWHVGKREYSDALIFMEDVAGRVIGRIQLNTDGFKAYYPAIAETFGDEVDHGVLIKVLESALENISAKEWLERRREQPQLRAVHRIAKVGKPNPEEISTSIVERHNRTIRMSLRRFARSTEAFSKKFENHVAMMDIFHVAYNFCRYHSSIRCTPAMEAGLSDHIWSYEELVLLMP